MGFSGIECCILQTVFLHGNIRQENKISLVILNAFKFFDDFFRIFISDQKSMSTYNESDSPTGLQKVIK